MRTPRNRRPAGKHFEHDTQLIWEGTTIVGCAMAVCGDSLAQAWRPAGHWVWPGS
ncbi:CAP domain-containing protein [Methyloterricola oryzae]|uniref:CAP domain-containing protein n=1 Tax=Methyloterricola oryzae TaxID=1495050 RepID=UPI0011AEF71F